MEVVKNEWKVDCQHIVNSVARRCRVIGRSTSRSELGFRIFQGFSETTLEAIIDLFEKGVDKAIAPNNKNNVPIKIITENYYNTVIKYFIVDNGNETYDPIIKFEFRASDDNLVYVNCQYSPKDPNLVQRRTWDRTKHAHKRKTYDKERK